MPCDTVVKATVSLSNAVKHLDLLTLGIEALGGKILSNQNGIIRAQLDGDVIEIANGQVTGRRVTQEQVIKIQRAYGLQAAKQAAKKSGWSFTVTGEKTFEFSKRSL